MAESEKSNSSPGKAKAKSSFLDEDMSKDFLSSWKSMSVAGGNDMDFNFEPVAKGNKKKAFDFGMDMDFSLDDAFGKMPSFKLDMPDIDFSSSPKKSSKSKEKETEEESTKGSRQTKNDKFSFSFDFNGFDDFNLDKPKTKRENKATGDKDNKQASSSAEIECKDSPRQTASCSAERVEDATHNELPTSKVAVNSKPCFSVEPETSLDASSCKMPPNTTIAVGQQKGTEISMDIECAEDAVEPGPESSTAMETSLKISTTQAGKHDFSSNSQSNPSHMLVGSEKVYESPGMDKIMPTQGVEEDNHRTDKISNQVFAEGKEQLQPTPVPVIKVSAKAISSNEEVCSPNGKLDHGSDAETLHEEIGAGALLSTESKTLNSDRSLPALLTENKNISKEGKMVGVVERQGNINSDTVASSITNFTKTINIEVSSNTESQIACLKDPPTQSDGEPNSTKSMLMRHKLSGGNNFSKERSTNDDAGTKQLMLERSKKGSTPLRAAGSSEGNEQKLEDNPRSSGKMLMKQELSVEKKEQNAEALSVGNRKENEEIRTKMVVDSVHCDGQAKKDSFRLPVNRKMSIDVKPLGIQRPSLATPEREAKSSNQRSGQLKDKSFTTEAVQKLNGGQVNRLSSARTDKIMPSLPSLRMSRNVTPSKLSSSSIVQDTKTVDHERIPRLQVKSKIVSPVNVQKRTPPIPSLKRKPTEAADLHLSKRLSPSESNFRMPRVSAREVENEVQTQRAVSEGSKTNTTSENLSPKFDFHLEANMETLGLTLVAEGDANVEKAEACGKELDDICSMLKKKHDEAKELLVRALVNNNNLLMLNHPICDEKIRQVQKFASRLMSREQEAGV